MMSDIQRVSTQTTVENKLSTGNVILRTRHSLIIALLINDDEAQCSVSLEATPFDLGVTLQCERRVTFPVVIDSSGAPVKRATTHYVPAWVSWEAILSLSPSADVASIRELSGHGNAIVPPGILWDKSSAATHPPRPFSCLRDD